MPETPLHWGAADISKIGLPEVRAAANPCRQSLYQEISVWAAATRLRAIHNSIAVLMPL